MWFVSDKCEKTNFKIEILAPDESTISPISNTKRDSKISVSLQGNTLILNCSVEVDKQSTLDVIWSKDGEVINVFNDKSKISFIILRLF
jgi:hypothetical protein